MNCAEERIETVLLQNGVILIYIIIKIHHKYTVELVKQKMIVVDVKTKENTKYINFNTVYQNDMTSRMKLSI